MYIPVLGALALAGGTIVERIVLKKDSIKIEAYHVATFLAMVLIMLPFVYFFWNLEMGALSLKNILIFLVIIGLSIVANLFMYFSLKWEKLSKLEPAKMMEPLFVILLAIIFSFIFGEGLYDRNLKVIIPALIAGIVLIVSHIKKHHFEFNKYFIAAILGSLFFALELVVSKLILDFYSPMTFYFLRCLGILIISFALFRPTINHFGKKNAFYIFLTGLMWVAYRTVVYYGYSSLGIISTTLGIMLGPIFIYALAWIFLKDRISWRNFVASIVILGCVLYGIFA